MNKNVPKWKLEWYLRGALPERERRAIAALERSDAELRGRIDALRASDAEIMAKPPPMEKMLGVSAGVCPNLRMELGLSQDGARHNNKGACPLVKNGTRRDNYALLRLTSIPAKVFRLLFGDGGVPRWAIPAFACAALIIAFPVWMVLTNSGGSLMDDTAIYCTRVKGDMDGAIPVPGLEVWRKAGDDAEMLAPGASVRTGDTVQLRYTVPESCYGALLSMDGRGVLTVHLAGSDGKAVPLTPGRPVALKTSYKLDDAPEFEAFYLITASEDFYIDSVALLLKKANHPIINGGNNGLFLSPQKKVTAFTLLKSGGGGIN